MKQPPRQRDKPSRGERGSGAKVLGDHPLPLVRIECDPCQRRGQWLTAKLIEQHGTEIGLPWLKRTLTGCERRGYNDYCKARYVDLLWLEGRGERVPPWPKPRRATPPQLHAP